MPRTDYNTLIRFNMKALKKVVANIDGTDVLLVELCADNGTKVSLTNIGATITSIIVPDKDGKLGEVVLGFDDPMMYLDKKYLDCGYFFGATVGRYANRIGKGHFSIDNKSYQLEINNGPNHLHGGTGSFNTKLWNASTFESNDRAGVSMSYVSPNMENGYPGQLSVTVVFTLSNDGSLSISYQAKTDKKTIINLTNHSYFNLGGTGDILDTNVKMKASRYTPKDDTNIPTGEVESVEGTALDFLVPHTIGARIMQYEDGYDHNLVIDGVSGELRLAATAVDERSGRQLDFLTTEPGFQFYTAYYLGGEFKRGDLEAKRFAAFCFEAQHYPDSPNKKAFPSVLLSPGETYSQTTVYKFSIAK